jgi:hypothetical protein
MTVVFEMALRDIDPRTLDDLKNKYPEAVVRIESEHARYESGMDEDGFWAVIDLFNWKKTDRQDVIAPAVEALSRLDATAIYAFHDILHEKLYALDGRRFAEQLGSNRFAPGENKYFSVDDFLYARCAVVANGRIFFETVLHNPKRMPKEYTFETILYLPELAWKMKTGRDDYNHSPDVWCETFSNSEGWPGITPLKDRLLNL